MALNRRNSEKSWMERNDSVPINSPGFALGRTVGTFLALPGLRGFWPMSVVGSTGQVNDISTTGLHLTNNNSVGFGLHPLIPYATFNGTTQRLSRATEANLAVTGVVSMASWVRLDNPGNGLVEVVCGKKGNATNRAYFIEKAANGSITANISADGSTVKTVTSTVTILEDTWYFVCLSFNPSTSLSITVNGTTTTSATSIPASIFNTAVDFTIGASGEVDEYLDGDISFTALSAYNYPAEIIFNLFEQSRLNFFGVS